MINFDFQELTRRAAVTLGTSHPLGDLICYQSTKRKPDEKVNDRCLVCCFSHSSNGGNQHEAGKPGCRTPAVNTPNTPPNPAAPVAGANSFTEGQAKSRIESKGFRSVSHLKKDDTGVWRGQAMQNDKTVNVSVDFQGNVVAQ